MKDFWKMFLASLLGSMISCLTILFLFFFILIVITTEISSLFSIKEVEDVKSNSILIINLDQKIVEQSSDVFSSFSLLEDLSLNSVQLLSLIKTIEYAGYDDNVKGILLYVSSPDANYATLQSIRKALVNFRQRGKWVIAYGHSMNQKAYFVASAANKVFLSENGNLELKGLHLQLLFFKKALEKLNIDMQVVRHGKFKSAIEPFVYEKMSPENRIQYEELARSIWKTLADSIAYARNIHVAEIDRITDELLAYPAKSALKYKLIDSLLYFSDSKPYLNMLLQIDDLNFISFKDYFHHVKEDVFKISSEKIAIIYAFGDIVNGYDYEYGSIPGQYYAELINKLARDEYIKAIVLRINSPGGDAMASEAIWHAIKKASVVKPVVVSMGDYAASGGYYISCSANYIFAEPTTITGSIGVFGLIPNVKKLFNEKLGITVDEIKTHQHSDYISIYKPLSSFDMKLLQKELDNIYQNFIKAVSEGRKLQLHFVDSIAQGRVWTGLDAYKLHLVDTLGSLQDAIEKAASLAQLQVYSITEYPKKVSSFEKLLENIDLENRFTNFFPSWFTFLQHYVGFSGKIWIAKPPYDIEFN
ncbi:MAG: signal peptide peptidase SppA [Bacteroidales bacterium]|nr:signal peptide peptidase SppA [Bacteroidales bacterium]